MTTRSFTVWRKSDISSHNLCHPERPTTCHPERSNCFRLRRQLRSRKPALSEVEGDLLLLFVCDKTATPSYTNAGPLGTGVVTPWVKLLELLTPLDRQCGRADPDLVLIEHRVGSHVCWHWR